MPRQATSTAELSTKDLAWLKGLATEGIGSWVKGNRPLTQKEFDRLVKLIDKCELPCVGNLDAHEVYFITICVPTSAPGVEPERVLRIAHDNFPGYRRAIDSQKFRERADDRLQEIATSKKNVKLLKFYGLKNTPQ
jgi:hypothetical protein